jgi:hypothetical protein
MKTDNYYKLAFPHVGFRAEAASNALGGSGVSDNTA